MPCRSEDTSLRDDLERVREELEAVSGDLVDAKRGRDRLAEQLVMATERNNSLVEANLYLIRALETIRDSTYRSALMLRALAADAIYAHKEKK